MSPRSAPRRVFTGVAASSGIAIGTVLVVNRSELGVAEHEIEPEAVEAEVERFRAAVERTRAEILAIQERFARDRGFAGSRILEPHLLMLRDTMAIDETENAIRRERRNAEFIFGRIMGTLEETLAGTPDEYLRERAADFRDVRRRVLRQLTGEERAVIGELVEPVVLVAPDLYPADTAQMRPGTVLGFATERGGRTSHTAILARQLEIPAVVGAESLAEVAENGMLAVVDGNHGRVILNPLPEEVVRYERERDRYQSFHRSLLQLTDLPAVTLDGREVRLRANVGLPHEAEQARRHGARGIGLFRTEFLFLGRSQVPNEEEQFQVYRRALETMHPDPVTFRTLDLGEDKALHTATPDEIRPAIGWRGVRLCMAFPDLFRTQVRALYRAGRHGEMRVMYPMVSGLEELRRARRFTEDAARDLAAERGEKDRAVRVPIGIMIETPAAAIMARELAREADFFSIGTNDLIQYTLAVDRQDERLSHLFEPLDPAILRLIDAVVRAGEEAGIPVSVCGEMSGDPLSTVVLVGLGVDEISTSPAMVPEIKRIIRAVHHEEARAFARGCLALTTASEVREWAKSELDARFWGPFDDSRT